MITRFQGSAGRPALLMALRSQYIVRDDAAIAAALADRVSLAQHAPGAALISQDAADNDLYFILSGRVVVEVHGSTIGFRAAGTHVGEMATIDPSARRSATVVAVEPTVTAQIKEQDFCEIADRHPKMWRYVAMELGNRLRLRNQFIRQPNVMPQVFLGSSRESLPVVNALVPQLDPSRVFPMPWTGDIFWPSHATIEDLESIVPKLDFAVLVFGPDDTIISRQVSSEGPRDNVLVEFGMFVGALGRDRTYFLKPRGVGVKVPSDLFGLTPLEYDVSGSTYDVRAAASEIMRCVGRYGAR
ncbi:MAG TPA: nucleotide-binding protein [Kiritimatiellia bacterium]|nr:nucleotide-binding protein [Kiritimatiellia bacterium]